MLAETVDRDRAAYIKHYIKLEWPLHELYDLVINSSLSESVVVDTILSSVAAVERSLASR
jgi:hypothetical protein